ncbi:nuclear protein localization protein 4 homolog [Phyllostomus discolor]|uniref:Nuclear protein localization protein 4 homolog n=1 Tax=Phyllostomus discolor TaxID=89673 RepID=A0A7E6CE03_9CHIR|nr:nuclear protein localization protein 4 homolog [Phyllostomus discolor]
MADSIIIRVQSPDGVKRITATKRETAAMFLKKVPVAQVFTCWGPRCLVCHPWAGLPSCPLLSRLAGRTQGWAVPCPLHCFVCVSLLQTRRPRGVAMGACGPQSRALAAGLLAGGVCLCFHVARRLPLGIRAEVAAIYEPPQVGTQNSLELLEDPRAEVVDEIAAKLGLRKVGWIFTDLVSEDTRKGTVRYSRNKDTYFLSAEECITAGDFQNKHPNVCRLSPDGHFGSKFVTAVATGGPDNQVHFEGYQVSNQCMALVRDECLLPCKDAPELGYAKESSSEQYVPDVFYKDIDKFGNEITQLARPLPVEYLIIDITTTFPKDPVHTFSASQTPFPIENRDVLGETQDFHSLATYLSQNTSSVFLDTVSDFHLLLFLVTNEVMPLQDSISLLLEAVRTRDEELAQTWKKSEQWATIEQLCSTVGVQLPGLQEYGAVGGSPHATAAAMWACEHCTFMNQPGTGHCEMCSLPRT